MIFWGTVWTENTNPRLFLLVKVTSMSIPKNISVSMIRTSEADRKVRLLRHNLAWQQLAHANAAWFHGYHGLPYTSEM